MNLFTAHKILISSAVALFVLYAMVEVRGALAGDEAAAFKAAASAIGAIGLAVYLRSVIRRGTI